MTNTPTAHVTRTRWVALSVVVLLGLGLWAATRPDRRSDEPSDAETRSAEPRNSAAVPPPALAAPPSRVTAAVARSGRGSVSGVVRHRDGTPAVASVAVVRSRAIVMSRPRPRGEETVWEASVLEETSPPRPDVVAQSADDGRFEVDRLGAGMYYLVATTQDGARGTSMASLVADGARVEENIEVSRGDRTLRGHVMHADGTPFRGTVSAKPAPEDGRTGFTGPFVTQPLDANGRFVLSGLESDALGVVVVGADSFFVARTRVVIPAEGEWVLVVNRGLSKANGQVVSDADGAPVAGATVRGGFTIAGCQIAFRTSSDADGRFEVPVAGEEGAVSVYSRGYVPVETQGFRSGAAVEIRLTRGARIEGRATFAVDGTPVEGATVYLALADEFDPVGPEAQPTTTDAQGRFAFEGLEAGDGMLVVEGRGFTTKGLADMRDDGFNPLAIGVLAGQTTRVEIAVVRGSVVRGVVVDAAGVAVPGATVAWLLEGGYSLDRYHSYGLHTTTSVVSGADGRFTLDDLPAGASVELMAKAPRHAWSRTTVRTLSAERPLDVTIRFPDERWIAVTVLDATSGRPISGASVSAGRANGEAVTGADGTARAGPFEPDVTSLDVEAPEYLPAKASIGEGVAVVRLDRGVTLEGRVNLPDGSPAAGATIVLSVTGSRFEVLMKSLRGRPVWHTAADGTFHISGLPRDQIGIQAAYTRDGEDWTASARGTPGDVPVRLALARVERRRESPKVVLLLRVLGPDGRPVPVAEGTYETDAGKPRTFDVAEGRAELVGSKAGGRVEVWGARTRAGERLPFGPGRLDRLESPSGKVEVRLPADRPIVGRVRTADGAGVPNVGVSAERTNDSGAPSGASFVPNHERVRTDADGAFRVGGIGEGEYRLSISAPRDFAPIEPIPVRAGAVELDVVLRASPAVEVTVLDAAGRPIESASVEPDDGSTAVASDETGVARLRGLDARKTYVLTVRPPDARDDLASATIDSFEPGNCTVRLGRGYSVSGFVRDAAGRTVVGVRVHWHSERTDDRRSGSEPVRSDGSFTLRNLPEGEIALEAEADGSPEASHAKAQVTAGAKGVVLVVDVGVSLAIRIENWPSEFHSGEAGVWPEGAGPLERGASTTRWVDADGTVAFHGLRPGVAYTLAVKPVDGLTLVRSGLRPGPDEVRLRLVPGKSIRGRIVVPPGVHGVTVRADLGLDEFDSVPGVVRDDGTYEIRGLADALWHVCASARAGGNDWRAEGSARAGESLDLTPAPGR